MTVPCGSVLIVICSLSKPSVLAAVAAVEDLSAGLGDGDSNRLLSKGWVDRWGAVTQT